MLNTNECSSLLDICLFNCFADGPSFATSLTDTEVLVGRNFTLSCSATGNPPPTISWSRRGRLLPIGSQTIAISPEGDKLTLPFIDTSDSGEYTCTAENVVTDQGSLVRKSVSSTAQLIVIGKYVDVFLFVRALV